MNNKLMEKMKEYVDLFDLWADLIYQNADEAFIQNNYAENKLYKVISNDFQEADFIDLKKIRSLEIYDKYKENLDLWEKFYEERFSQNNEGMKLLVQITSTAIEISEILRNNDWINNNFGKTLFDVFETSKILSLSDLSDRTVLEDILIKSFSWIEKSYVEFCYSSLEKQLQEKGINDEDFWEEPIMEYIMGTWWPKRRVYTNKILAIDIENYPDKIDLKWFEFMSEKFYKCGIFNFLKQIRNQITHVKTSDYHDEVMKSLFSTTSLVYWCQMNMTLVIYVVCYLSVQNQK